MKNTTVSSTKEVKPFSSNLPPSFHTAPLCIQILRRKKNYPQNCLIIKLSVHIGPVYTEQK